MPTFREDPKIGTKVPLIKTADLNDKSVTEKKLADGSITKDKIATGAVTSEKIAEGAVSVDEIKDLSVEESKINNKAVTNVKIGDAAVDTRTIEDKSVTNAKIADESVSTEKLQSGLRSTIVSTHEKAIELDKKKANVTDVDYALECLENKIGDRVVVEGNVTNLPDDEDLTSVSTIDGREVMKLNDRAYEPSNFSGKGYKILRKNIQRLSLPTVTILVSNIPSSSGDITITINGKTTTVALDVATDTTTAIIATKIGTALKSSLDDYDVSVSSSTIVLTRNNSKYASPSSIDVGNTTAGITVKDSITKSERKNILTQDMIDKPNTVYEIRYGFDLNGEEIIINDGCVLNFVGGTLKGGNIQFNETLLTGNEILIECSCTGIVKNSTLTPNMFGAKQDGFTDDVPFIQQAIELLNNRGGGTCLFKKGTYLIGSINVKLPNCSQKGAIHIRPNISYIGENNTIIKVKDNSDGFEGIFVGNDHYDSNNINFDNLIFDFNGVNNLYKQEWITNKTTFFMAGIRVCYAANVKITNSIFKENPGLNCIILSYTEHGYVGNCSFVNVADSVKGNYFIPDHSAVISAGSDFKAENNRFVNDIYSATEEQGENRVNTAIECNAYGQIITNNYIENFNIGILPSPVGITALENAVINNNIIKNCNCALSVWCSNEDSANFTNLLFSNNLIECSLNNTFAIDLIRSTSDRTSNIQIVNNTIFNKAKDKQHGYIGIYAGNGIHELIIKGNSFINLSSSAIVVTSGKNIQIDNNCIIGCGNNLLDSQNTSLISLETTNSFDKQDTPIIDNVTITNNLLGGTTDNTSEVVGFSIYGDVRYITFRNNIIDKCGSDFSLDNMTSIGIEGNYFNMDHKTNGWSEYAPNINVSPGSILTDLKRNIIYYKTTNLSETGWEKANFILGDNYGPTPPDASSDKVGRIFFNTNTQKPVFCNGVDWLDVDGIKTGIPRKGVSNNMPNMEYIYIQEGKDGFQYYNTEIKKSFRWVGDNWYEYDAEVAYIKRSGSFSSKPIPSNIGFQYFNTDTHKMITWDGDKWWNPDGTEATM